jgi:hypothetical protein
MGYLRSRWARHGIGSKSLRPIFLNSRPDGLARNYIICAVRGVDDLSHRSVCFI